MYGESLLLAPSYHRRGFQPTSYSEICTSECVSHRRPKKGQKTRHVALCTTQIPNPTRHVHPSASHIVPCSPTSNVAHKEEGKAAPGRGRRRTRREGRRETGEAGDPHRLTMPTTAVAQCPIHKIMTQFCWLLQFNTWHSGLPKVYIAVFYISNF